MSALVLVLDFGGQYKELIARTVRGLSVYAEILPGHLPAAEIAKRHPVGIILTGGPNSVYADSVHTNRFHEYARDTHLYNDHVPVPLRCDPAMFTLGIPVLGICYGMQLMCHMLGGEVAAGTVGEYGRVTVTPTMPLSVLFDFPGTHAQTHMKSTMSFTALMSHRDRVTRLPEGFRVTAATDACPVAACENPALQCYGTQFHPESAHTSVGREIIKRFLYDICGATGDYRLDDYSAAQTTALRQRVGDKQILLALSGGVDSSVCAALLSHAVPRQLVCVFVDHGFMREGEADEIERVFTHRKLRFIRVNAAERFLRQLAQVTDPEEKRKNIGETFIRVFEEEAAKLGNIPFLAQGTIYPDIIESGGQLGATIKSHHNVGGLPEGLSFEAILEPLAGLFKDEVRILGKKLGLPAKMVNRQPFPGPGLAIRVMGAVTAEKLAILRQADAICRAEIARIRPRPQQYFAVLTDTCSVGVKGDGRTYEPVVAIRAVTTEDFMTCDYAPIPHTVLRRLSARITGEIPSVSRVVYDITSKPPATVEWE